MFGGWAALAPLDSAAVAPGVIKVAGERKLVQHLEGGIVAAVNAANGDVTEAGKVLIRLDDTQARAQLGLVKSRIASREALAARLRAERDGKVDIDFDQASVGPEATPAAREAVVTHFFADWSASVQHQGWLMAGAVLEAVPEIEEIEFRLPNQHHIAFDLARFGMDDEGVVFQPTSEPFGDIRFRVVR